jgi:hypothetical protein
MHEGFQPWPGVTSIGTAFYGAYHIMGELYISHQRKAQAISAAQNAFKTVFGAMANFEKLTAMTQTPLREVVTTKIIYNPKPPPSPPLPQPVQMENDYSDH